MSKIPDLLTHVLIGLSVALVLKGSIKNESSTMILLGSILPDVERPFTWLLEFLGLENVGLTPSFHSILGVLLLSFAAASLFDTNTLSREQRFLYLLLGCSTHLLLDMTMYPWTELGLFLLFPLRQSFSFHLLWPDYPFYPLFGLAVFLLSLLYVKLKPILARRR